MAYQIAWYIDQRVLEISINGQVSIDEFEQLHLDSFALVEKSPYKVHAIADMSQFDAMPTNLKMLTSASSQEKNHNQGMTILVMPKVQSVIRFLMTVVMQTLKLEYRICETREEAIDVLKRIDADLNNTMQNTVVVDGEAS